MGQLASIDKALGNSFDSCVLLYGREFYLLEIRRWLLERAGFRVCSTTDAAEVAHMILFERPQHLVVCHTIPDKEVQEVLEAAHTLRPTMSNLILETTRSMRSLAEKDRVLSIFAGSRVMLDVLIADVNAAAPPN